VSTHAPHSPDRARLLFAQGRYDEAAAEFKKFLRHDPESVSALMGLAFCLYQSDDPKAHREGLEVTTRAAALDPEEPEVFFIRGILLAETRDYRAAHEAIDRALALAPECARYFGAKALVHLKQEQWAKAEASAREGLALDADDPTSANALANALLMRGDTGGHAVEVGRLLSRDPEDPQAHYNMGLAALRAGNHRDAERHFKEVLRLRPGFDPARHGLLEAFRSRSPLYRAFLKLSFRLSQLSPGVRTATMLGVYVAYRVARGLTETKAPLVAAALGFLWLTFALFTFVGRGLGNLIILFDRTARHALDRKERWEGFLVGGGITAGLALVLAGLATGVTGLVVAGACFIAPSIPASVAYRTELPSGRWIYGVAAAAIAACAAVVLTHALMHPTAGGIAPWASPFLTVGLATTLLVTWAAFFGFRVR
jgi:Flp pilus assembly protein TadD